MEATVDGIVADVDTEFLHDFRVAVRRTRSVLKLLGDVLPDGTGRADRGPSSAGSATSPPRPVISTSTSWVSTSWPRSVSRPRRPATVRRSPPPKRRAAAQRALVRALRSERFPDLCRSWRAELAGDHRRSHSPRARPPPRWPTDRLHRTFRKVTKRARADHTPTSPSEEIHALRKTCKEMRYLLDVFKPLCDPKAYRKVIADFKQLQDILGEFQDGEVQADALHALRRSEMLADAVGRRQRDPGHGRAVRAVRGAAAGGPRDPDGPPRRVPRASARPPTSTGSIPDDRINAWISG